MTKDARGVLALGVTALLFGSCYVCVQSLPESPDCDAEWAEWRASRDRRDALRARWDQALAAERVLIDPELFEAWAWAQDAERAWSDCRDGG